MPAHKRSCRLAGFIKEPVTTIVVGNCLFNQLLLTSVQSNTSSKQCFSVSLTDAIPGL